MLSTRTLLLSFAVSAITVAGCLGSSNDLGRPSTESADSPDSPSASADMGASASAKPTPDPSGSGAIEPGTLTAGVWDDNRNFDFFTAYQSDRAGLPGHVPFTAEEQRAAHDRLASTPGPRQRLDVALVVDTTGSMGDELKYLQVELAAIADQVEAKYPGAQQRWAAVFYRDLGDAYVVRSFDFRADLPAFLADLSAQSADGGGDTPEAPDAALDALVKLSWRADADVARITFWIADAPHHLGHEQAMLDAVRAAAQGDVHLYPIAASGTDPLTELTMRQSAQLTGGRYLFLTNDSGVGNAHAEPTVPCYFVTNLLSAMRRMLAIELSGVYTEPDAADLIRTGGDPTDGHCRLADDREVLAF